MEKFVVRKVIEYRGYPVLVQQVKDLFIYVVYIPKKGFYSASIESVLPFWRKNYSEQEVLAATNLALTAAYTTIDNVLDGNKPKPPQS